MCFVFLAFQCVERWGIQRSENGDGDGINEIFRRRMSGLLYADDLVLNGESEEDLRVMKKPFVEIYERKVLKINAHKSKVMVLGGLEARN